MPLKELFIVSILTTKSNLVSGWKRQVIQALLEIAKDACGVAVFNVGVDVCDVREGKMRRLDWRLRPGDVGHLPQHRRNWRRRVGAIHGPDDLVHMVRAGEWNVR